jgi:hypothetical protein
MTHPRPDHSLEIKSLIFSQFTFIFDTCDNKFSKVILNADLPLAIPSYHIGDGAFRDILNRQFKKMGNFRANQCFKFK